MFKRILVLFLVIAVLCMPANFVDVSADNYNGFEFSVSNGEITITNFPNSGVTIEVPAEIDGNPVKYIGNNASRNRIRIEEVILPDSVVSIGTYAFYGCTNLRKIVIYNTLESIAASAFRNCNNLSEVEYRGTEEERESLSVGNDNTPFLNATFTYVYDKYCGENVIWKIVGDTLSISGTGSMFSWDAEEDVPWFDERENIKKVVISDGITDIGKYAFKSFVNLECVEIGNTVTEIGERAFDECESINEIKLDVSVERIGNNAFGGCRNLNTVYFGDNLNEIEDFAFEGCDNIETTYYTGSEDKWNQINIMGGNDNIFRNINYYFGRSGTCGNDVTWLLNDEGKLQIEGEGEMDNYESSNDENIPWYSLKEEIKEIEVNSKDVGDFAFAKLSAVSSVYLAEHVSNIGKGAFFSCTELESISIPDNVHKIENDIFWGCENLTEISMSQDIESIGDSAFAYCKNLNMQRLPDRVKSIGYEAFVGCENIEISELFEVETIGNSAFSGCKSMRRLSLPQTLTSIGANAFINTSISEFEINSRNAVFSSDSGNIYNKNKTEIITYAPCKTDTTFNLPTSVTVIGNNAFNGNKNLERVSVSENLRTIGDCAFLGCEGLLEFEIPENVTRIGECAFEFCTNLRSIEIPDSVTEIGVSTFCRCENLENVTIGSGITRLVDNMFNFCGSLKDIPVGINTVSIGESTFAHALSAEYLTIPDCITSIGNNAFDGCETIKGVTMSESLLTIGEGAFKDCINLIDVTVPDSVTLLGSRAFEGCENLSSATLGTGITKLEEGVFDRCINMTNITIPKEITEFGDNVCGGCENLKTVYYSGTAQKWSEIHKGDNHHLCNLARRKYIRFVTFKDKNENILYKAKTLYNVPILLHIIPVQGDNIAKLYLDKNLTRRYDTTDDTPVTEDLVFYMDDIAGTKTLVSDENDSLGGEMVFNVKGLGLKEGTQVILALYNNGMFVGLETAIYKNGGIVFKTNIEYTSAKVMVWQDNKGMKPVHECEKVKTNTSS